MEFVVELKISEFEDTDILLEVSCECGEGLEGDNIKLLGHISSWILSLVITMQNLS